MAQNRISSDSVSEKTCFEEEENRQIKKIGCRAKSFFFSHFSKENKEQSLCFHKKKKTEGIQYVRNFVVVTFLSFFFAFPLVLIIRSRSETAAIFRP